MKRLLLIPSLALLITCSWAQELREVSTDAPEPSMIKGRLGVGVRSTMNIFSGYRPGIGAGGHWKLGFSDRVNTEWFLDYITSEDDKSGYRKDYHIGWAVQFNLLNNGLANGKINPYVMGGQCFDLTQVGTTGETPMESPKVFSAAVQAGVGVSTFIASDFEVNLQGHYMMHLGKDVHLDYETDGHGHDHASISVDNHPGLEGHFLTTISGTWYFVRLWK